MKLGFIGLGNLGTPIAENLLRSTKQLYIYNRTSGKADPLVNQGAELCSSVKELAAKSDIVFSVLSDDAALKQVTSGSEGIAENLKPGGVHVSVSTILPQTAKELSVLHSKHGNIYVASPVMGRPEAARAGKLNFIVSGDKNAIAAIKPFLMQAGASGVWEFGEDVAAAHTAKLCSNFLVITVIESLAEGIQLAEKSGLDAKAWLNMLTQTLFSSPIYINYANILLNKNWLPASFSLKLGLKDVNLVLQQAATAKADMPFGKILHQQLTESTNAGLADHDLTAMAMILK